MTLWLATHFLFAALFLSSSALTPKECRPLVEPQSLSNISMVRGRVNFLVGYVDHGVYRDILKVTDSSWLNITESDSELVVSQENKINGVCFGSTSKLTSRGGDTADMSVANVTTSFHLLPTCEGCVVFSINSTARNVDQILQMMNITSRANTEDVHAHAIYLLGSETTLKDADLERFKLQAGCLGFSGEPDFQYDPEKGFCREGEGVRMQ